MNADVTPRQIVLEDRRRLSWYEFGDASGAPCIFLPGSSSSGIAGRALDTAATAAGIRLISIDRPGLGHSDRAPVRRLVDWPDDVAALLDQEGIDRVGVLGHSAGGAFALAVADRLGDRVSATVVCAGSGPYSERWFRDEAHQTPTSRVFYGLALHAPRLFGAVLSAGTPRTAKGIDRTVSLMSRGTSPDGAFARTHPEETRAAMEAVADGFRQGHEGPTDDARLICSPWGFELEDVHAPVEWWHGEQDGTVKPEAGRAITARLPHATMHLVEGGHTLLFERPQEILEPVRRT
jgi:pimeloyl-ACP methyl ester carboxylesterase